MKRSHTSAVLLSVLISVSLFSLYPLNAQDKKASRQDQRRAAQSAKQADAAFIKKDYRTALDAYRRASELDPANADYRFWKGASHYYLNEYALALPDLNAAESMAYRRPTELYGVRWVVNYKLGNLDAASEDVRKGLAIEPNNVELLQGLGDIAFERKDYKGAIEAYEKVLTRNPNSTGDLYFQIAKSHAMVASVDAQIAMAQEAVKRGTRYLSGAEVLIGEGRLKQRRTDDAIQAFQSALRADPGLRDPYFRLAAIYAEQNRFSDAIEVLRRALRAFPSDGDIYTNLSFYYSLANRHEEAVQAAQAGVRFHPERPAAYTNLCRAYNDLGRPEMAIRECSNALRRQPEDGETLFYLGRAHDLSGKADEAAKFYKRAVPGLEKAAAESPNSAQALYLLGNAYYANAQIDKAIGAYQRTLALSPRFVKARYNLAIIQLRSRNRAGAMEQYNELLKVDPELAAKLKSEIDRAS